jgi:hypothetical protein
MAPVDRGSADSHIGVFSIVNQDLDTYEEYGIIPEIFKIASEKYNFKDEYQPVIPHYQTSFIADPAHDKFEIIIINKTYREPNVCIELLNINTSIFNHVRQTVPFLDMSRILLVSPGERYTPYDRLFLPFDKNSWMFIFGTVCTVLSILFVVDNLSRRTEPFVFGGSTLKVLRIFLGSPQTRMPHRYFSRLILIFFIFFCLIIRACFQSKIFQIITSDQRHPPPKTISDLIDRHYTVYTLMSHDSFEFLETDYNIR